MLKFSSTSASQFFLSLTLLQLDAGSNIGNFWKIHVSYVLEIVYCLPVFGLSIIFTPLFNSPNFCHIKYMRIMRIIYHLIDKIIFEHLETNVFHYKIQLISGRIHLTIEVCRTINCALPPSYAAPLIDYKSEMEYIHIFL